MLVEGKWREGWIDTRSTGGRFVRSETRFRDRITADGASGFPPAVGRYHLYVSLACPWAHRTLIFRALKGLEGIVGLSVVDPFMGDQGWWFSDGPGCVPDTVNGARHLHEIYTRAEPDYSGRVTVPVLWDTETATIVNNESSEIIRMFNSAFDSLTGNRSDFYPEPLRSEIDSVNADVYDNINNGVYKAGFATTQEAYEEAFDSLFAALDRVEARLSEQRYLCGARLTEADWRLFTTLFRFDAVYVGHFKCNLRRIADTANLWNTLRELYQVPGVAETCDLSHIKRHYYGSHTTINPTRVVPKGPALDFDAPHDRDRFSAEEWRG
jgi:putative glutathione S-transferase